MPYPRHLRKEKIEVQYGKFLEMIRVIRINVPFVDVLAGMPNYAKFLKELEVIENGNSFKPVPRTTQNVDGTSTSMIPGAVTTEEKAQKNNDVKARSMLLMTLPNEHLSTFNQYKDAKTLFDAIQTRFGGNDTTKKTQKKLLKQKNKLDLDTISFDDLYNNFKIVEQEVKRTTTSSTSSSSQNMAFVSSPSSTNEVKTANVQVSTANSLVSTDSTLDSTANLNDLEEMDLKWQLALLSMRARRYYRRTGKKITINESDTAETSSKAMVAIDGASFDWSFMADKEVTTNMALMAFSDSKFNLATYKRGLASVEEKLVFYKKIEVIFSDQIVVLKRDTSFKDSKINVLKSEIEKLKKEKESNQIKIDKFEKDSKCLDKLIGSLISDNNRKGVGLVSYNAILPLHTGLFAPPAIDLSNSSLKEFQHPEFKGYGPKASKSVCVDTSNEVKKTHDTPIG
ncbi:hypothetical protein Tco_1240627 [Tanacetum coccineum]